MFLFSASTSKGSGSTEHEDLHHDELEEENPLIQSGAGHLKKNTNDEELIGRIVKLVTEQITNSSNPLKDARPVNTTWSNFDLSPPSTSVINSANTVPPIHFTQTRIKNDDNDSFDETRLLKTIPPRHRYQAQILLQQFNQRGVELTWNSDGVIFIDQTSIPQSNIFVLFPYLFKMKHPKDLPGFDDFLQKIQEMGLGHLTVKKIRSKKSEMNMNVNLNPKQSDNWWYIG